MTFTKIAEDAMDTLQLNAGVLLSNYDIENPLVEPDSEDIIATTQGGINAVCEPTYEDFAENVDNAPNNLKEFKRLTGWNCSMSFTSIKFNAENTEWGLGAADTTTLSGGIKKITPRKDVEQTDFKDIWWVGDKANGGAYAVKLINALSTGGLNIQSTKNEKGTIKETLTGHVSINDQNKMPMEFYDIPSPSESSAPDIILDKSNITLVAGSKQMLNAVTTPAGQTVTWSSSATDKATVSNGEVTAVSAGTAVITASITVDGHTYTDTCNVTVVASGS